MTVRAGLNVMWLAPGVVGGSEDYTVALIDALADRPDLDLTLFANERFAEVHAERAGRIPTVVAPVSGDNRVTRVGTEALWLPRASSKANVDLMHHLGGTMPPMPGRPAVLTVHDLQPLMLPDNFSKVKRAYMSAVLPWSARHADVVVTLSTYTRDQLVETLGVDRDRTVVVAPGIDEPSDAELARWREHDVRTLYGLEDRPLFIYPAITYPHKNHCFLIDVFANVAEQHPDALLLLPGGTGPDEAAVMARIRDRGVWNQVHRLGRIPRVDLDALYLEAVGLVFPSKFEGFGIPLLEAMVRDCPVIAADTTAIPEAVGDGGVLLAPDNHDAWVDAIGRLLDDHEMRGHLVEVGRQRARSYDWADSAATLASAYVACLEAAA